MENLSIQQEVAQHLLQIKAIQLRPDEPFTWASGWYSPIYCDNRISLSFPDARTYIKNSLSAVVKAFFSDVDIIAGVATAGIAQGALVADYLDLPFCYVRPEPKKPVTFGVFLMRWKRPTKMRILEVIGLLENVLVQL